MKETVKDILCLASVVAVSVYCPYHMLAILALFDEYFMFTLLFQPAMGVLWMVMRGLTNSLDLHFNNTNITNPDLFQGTLKSLAESFSAAMFITVGLHVPAKLVTSWLAVSVINWLLPKFHVNLRVFSLLDVCAKPAAQFAMNHISYLTALLPMAPKNAAANMMSR